MLNAGGIKKAEYRTCPNFLLYGLIIYLLIFYLQIGGRVSSLGMLRIELLWGSAFLLIIVANLMAKRLAIFPNKINSVIAIFLIILFIEIPFAYVKRDALNTFIKVVKLFAIYIMIVTTVDNEQKLRKFIWVYVLMISFIFVEPFTWAIRGEGFYYNSGAMRLFGYGWWAHPNSLGGITVSNLPFFYFLFRYEKKTIIRVLLGSLMIIAIAVIMFTSSRTAFVGFLAFLLLLWFHSKKKLLATVALLVFLMVIWVLAPQETKDRFLTLQEAPNVLTEESTDGAMGNRWELIKNGWMIFKDNPVFGVGINNYISVSGRKYGMWLPSHNLYIQLLTEIGLVGTIVFGLLILRILSNLKKVTSTIKMKGLESSLEYAVANGVAYFLLLRLVLGLFGDDLIENYWWFTAGLSVALLRIVEEKPEIGDG